jgi:hypothetical protein
LAQILLDAYHWTCRWEKAINLDKNHELNKVFFSMMRDAMFSVCVPDYRVGRTRLSLHGDQASRRRILKECRRSIATVIT